ncbi:MAG: CRISPR-associated protein Cas4 [Thermoprotei archaeon]|nr:MAG: CRISPR-associated protein Cas4 [Thermoprotei archaeon]
MSQAPEFTSSNRIIELMYRERYSDFKEKYNELKNPGIIYVTEIASCSYKYHLRLKYPELLFSFEPITILGVLVHRGLQGILEKHDFVPEYSIEKEYDIDGHKIKLKGRIDVYNPKENVVVEIKTSRSSQGTPREHHIEQLLIYMNIVDSEFGILVYITPDRILEYGFRRRSIDIEKRIIETLNNDVHPRWDWECRYCVYSKLCPFKKD